MDKFKIFTGLIAPLNRSNVDTDAIIPKQFLKSIKRSGFGKNLFDERRYLDQGDPVNNNVERKLRADFILNISPYDKAEILLVRENFGCGSSREHAVWALTDFGFRAVLAPSFGDIFYSNSFKNGFLPIRLNNETIEALFNAVEMIIGFKATIDLEKQFVETQTGERYQFEIEPSLKDRLLNGLDDIALILQQVDKIHAYEKSRAKITPWLFENLAT